MSLIMGKILATWNCPCTAQHVWPHWSFKHNKSWRDYMWFILHILPLTCVRFSYLLLHASHFTGKERSFIWEVKINAIQWLIHLYTWFYLFYDFVILKNRIMRKKNSKLFLNVTFIMYSWNEIKRSSWKKHILKTVHTVFHLALCVPGVREILLLLLTWN